ncbi:MAG: hypothetical protein E2O70_00535 [Candidatus Dadabacteria bacterium]|nr:MAG: hypothetical protein E2O70_00535 [Candidatus Dadabacteria bacterium]
MMGIHKTLLSAVLILLVSAYYSYTEELYVVNSDTSEVLRYDGTTGAFIDAFVTPGSGGLDNPNSLVFGGPNVNLFVNSSGNNAVLQYNGLSGAPVDQFVIPQDQAGFSFLAASSLARTATSTRAA